MKILLKIYTALKLKGHYRFSGWISHFSDEETEVAEPRLSPVS
jgi:hypothetical protein